jgi:hypothetical protein
LVRSLVAHANDNHRAALTAGKAAPGIPAFHPGADLLPALNVGPVWGDCVEKLVDDYFRSIFAQ